MEFPPRPPMSEPPGAEPRGRKISIRPVIARARDVPNDKGASKSNLPTYVLVRTGNCCHPYLSPNSLLALVLREPLRRPLFHCGRSVFDKTTIVTRTPCSEFSRFRFVGGVLGSRCQTCENDIAKWRSYVEMGREWELN